MSKRNYNTPPPRLNRIACIVATQLALPIGMMDDALARDRFNPALLELGTPGQAPLDLSAFEEKGGQIPGNYHVDVYLHNAKVETRSVEFRTVSDSKSGEALQPCLSIDELAEYGVLVAKFPELRTADATCANLMAIPQASADFRFVKQQLLLSIPQSAVRNSARGWVDPKQWDDGIPAALLNYSVSGANSWSKTDGSSNDSSQYVNLRPGVNLGPWRLRNYTTWTRSDRGGPNGKADSNWDTVYTYAQRDIKALKSQLTLGDSTSPSDIFDSVPFRGIQLASDDDMQPDSLKGYAPVVRGIARSNAQVTIRQNGYVIYQTYVSPGSFEINDMYPTGGSGDLYVTIKESDGSEQLLVIPYASLPVLQREGRLKYSITSAAYRAYDNSVDQTPFTQGTVIYGLPGGFTGYGGGQFSSRYQSVAAGVGKNLGNLGAVSVDMTQAWSRQQDSKRENGRSFRARYSKNILATGTNFAIAGYRYATDGYWNMQEVLSTYRSGYSNPLQERRRNRAEATMTQNLWANAGSVAFTAVWEDYWNTERQTESYGVSYNNSYNGINYGLSYAYTKNSSSPTGSEGSSGKVYSTDQLFALNVSVPLDKLFASNSKHPMYANYMMNTSKNGNTTNGVSVGGTTFEDNNLSWGVQEGYGNKGQGNSGSVNADWRAAYGEVNGGYSYDKYSRRLNYGIQGGIVAHESGITLSQPLGETVALVAAPGAKSVAVQGHPGVKTDWRGYTVVPYASPYRKNDITLNTETFSEDTEVAITTQTVIPTRGAVVKARYQASVGNRVLMTLSQSGGQPVPFGASAVVQNNKEAQEFIVGAGGQVYLTGLDEQGQLFVKWGNSSDEQCTAGYSIPKNSNGIADINGLCR